MKEGSAKGGAQEHEVVLALGSVESAVLDRLKERDLHFSNYSCLVDCTTVN